MKITLLLFFSLTQFLGFGQTEVIVGKAFRNPIDYHKDSSFLETTFNLKWKYKTGLAYGGYKLNMSKKLISKDEQSYMIWIIADSSYLYFNSTRNGFQNGYIKLEKGKKLYYFEADPMPTPHQMQRMQNSQANFGLIGASLSIRKIGDENERKYYNVLNIENGVVSPFTDRYIEKLLNNYPSLQLEFSNEPDQSNITRLQYYLEEVNIILTTATTNNH